MATNTAIDSFSYDPLPGKTLGGRYEIDRLIGRGGVGLVYLAIDSVENDREVVVKVLSPHWAQDRDAVARFEREALRMAKLDHANVVRMFDHGHFEGRAYIVMEFIQGEPLRRYLSRRKRLPLEEFIPIASQILLGVGYVHERGIMLRDIKPPNIMLSEHDGKANHVKLLDFGLARLTEEEDEEVTKAHVIGTAAYMSPEQIRGEHIDVRVDVYALGVLFFLMLTGEMPIAGDNDAAVLVNHVHGKPKSLVERLPKSHRIPAKLIEMIESCLAKDPDDRPSDANAMVEELFEFIPAPLLSQPRATAKTRAAAESYWAARKNTGPAAAAALASDTNDSAEWTRPLLRKAAKTGEAPLKLAEAEIEAARKNAQRVPQPPPAGARRSPPPPPPPRGATQPPLRGATQPPVRGATMPPPPPSSGPSLLAAPSSSTVRVTAADAREAVERFDAELEGRRTGRVAAVPLDDDAESSDIVPISLDDDDDDVDVDTTAANDNTGSTEVAIEGATVPASMVSTGGFGAGVLGSDAEQGRSSNRLGLIAIAGIAALVLGGLSAFALFGGDEDPSPDAASKKTETAAAVAGTQEAAAATTPALPKEAVPAPAAVGAVDVRAPDGASVEVDGEDRGKAPLQLELSPGQHQVRVSAEGHQDWEATIDVVEGTNPAVNVELVALEAEAIPDEETDEPVVAQSRGGRGGRGGRGKKPRRGPAATTPDPPPPAEKPKPKSGVFMESPKEKDDGIFLPVGGK